jgi:hypothetical protein
VSPTHCFQHIFTANEIVHQCRTRFKRSYFRREQFYMKISPYYNLENPLKGLTPDANEPIFIVESFAPICLIFLSIESTLRAVCRPIDVYERVIRSHLARIGGTNIEMSH